MQPRAAPAAALRALRAAAVSSSHTDSAAQHASTATGASMGAACSLRMRAYILWRHQRWLCSRGRTQSQERGRWGWESGDHQRAGGRHGRVTRWLLMAALHGWSRTLAMGVLQYV